MSSTLRGSGRIDLVLSGARGQGAKGDPGGNVMAIGLFAEGPAINVPTGTKMVRTSGLSAVGVGQADYYEDDQGSPSANAAFVAANPDSAFVSLNGRLFRLSPDTIDTIATLAALPAPVAGQQVRVAGRITYDDAAGGDFVFDTGVSAPAIAANPTQSHYVAPTGIGIMGAWRRKGRIRETSTAIGASPSTPGRKDEAINFWLQEEAGDANVDPRDYDSPISLDLGDGVYKIEDPLRHGNLYTYMHGKQAVIDCQGIADHGIVLDTLGTGGNAWFNGLDGLWVLDSVKDAFFLLVPAYLRARHLRAYNAGGAGYRLIGAAGAHLFDCAAHFSSGYGYIEEAGQRYGTGPWYQNIRNRLDGFHGTHNGGGILASESASFISADHDLEVNGGTAGNGVLLRGCFKARIIDPYHELHAYDYQDVAYPTGPFKTYIASIGGGTVAQGSNQLIRPDFGGELVGGSTPTAVSIAGVSRSTLDGMSYLGGNVTIDSSATNTHLPPQSLLRVGGTLSDGGLGTRYGGIRSGKVTFAAGDLSKAIVFPAGTEVSATGYIPQAQVVGVTGTPAIGAKVVRVQDPGGGGFTLALDAVPGSGNTVTVGWTVGPDA